MSVSYEEPWVEVEPEPKLVEDPNDLDGCAGIMFGALLSFIFFAFVVVACLAGR